MSQIEIKKIIKAINASDGAGVKLKRSIGTPEADYIDPFLMLDEFGSENKDDYIAGFPPHPHRGIETVTYMLAGDFEHKDSTGGEGRMTAGDVQWMKTGSGIIHSEMPAMKKGKLHGFQLWINMPSKLKMSKPEYIYIDAKYIATINNSHVDLIKKIIERQKKILCEKPIATSLQSFLEVEKLMLDKKIKFYEGIAYYSHPQTIEVLNLIDNDEIGNIEKIESTFGFKARYRPSSRLYNKELGGGSILDLGCYPISFFMLFAKLQEKIFISNKNLNYAKSGVDDEATATLNYDNKFEGKIHVSIKSNLENSCTIYGSKGFIKVKEPWSPSNNDVIEIVHFIGGG